MKGLVLMSGGIDSAVAARSLIDKGIKLSALHFYRYSDPKINPLIRTKDVCRHLNLDLYLTDFDSIIHEVASRCNQRYFFIITKRIMFKIAEMFALKEGYDFLVTGDSLGQVGSQTLQNMFVINKAIRAILLQPNLTLDKQEIINLAKEYGTYDLSTGPEICGLMGPKHPATKARLDKVLEQESNIDIENLVQKSFRNIKLIQKAR